MARRTGNPALAQPLADEIARRARRYLVAEFDMQTLVGLALKDQSGNGNDATFTSTPTVTAQGVSFNGGYYADFVLSAALRLGYSFALVMNGGPNGNAAFGSRNYSDGVGIGVRPISVGTLISSGVIGNDLYIPAIGAAFSAMTAKVYPFGQARARVMGAGILGYQNNVRPDGVADTRARWRIGAGAQTNGSNHDAPYMPLDNGTIAYIMLFNAVTSEEQDAAVLEYIAAKLAPRGIVL